MMLQALLLRNCELSRLLLSHMDDTAASASLPVSQSEVIVFAVVDVLARCSLFPAALGQTVIPLSQRTNDWLTSYAASDMNKCQMHPLWLRAVIRQLEPFTARITKRGVDRLISQSKRPAVATSFSMRQLPCSCRPAIKQDAVEAGGEDILMDCIYDVISQLVEDLHTLPLSLVILFHAMQESLHDATDLTAVCKSVLLKVLCFSFILFAFSRFFFAFL